MILKQSQVLINEKACVVGAFHSFTSNHFFFIGEKEWKKISPGCVPGHNIIHYKGKSVDECKALCLTKSKCLAFEMYADHGGSNPDLKPGECRLQSGRDPTGCDGKNDNNDLYIWSNKGNTSNRITFLEDDLKKNQPRPKSDLYSSLRLQKN